MGLLCKGMGEGEDGVLGDVEGMAFGMTVEDGGGRWWYFAFWILR